MASLIWFCVGPAPKICSGIGIDRLLIFDNTGGLPKRYHYSIPISNRSHKLVPLGLFAEPVIQNRSKRLLITALMNNLNSINDRCPKSDVEHKLPSAEDIEIAADTPMSKIQDTYNREADDTLSFAIDHETEVAQLKKDLMKVGKGDLLNNINVLRAFQNLIEQVGEEGDDLDLKSMLSFLECINEATSSTTKVINKDFTEIERRCTSQRTLGEETKGGTRKRRKKSKNRTTRKNK